MAPKKGIPKIFIILSVVMTTAFATEYFINVDSEWDSSSVFHHHHGYALIGHVIKSLSLFMADCMQTCQETLECFSVNYRSFVNGSFLCELNRSNKKQNPGSYVPKEGYQYSEPPRCQVGGTDSTARFSSWSQDKNWTDARQHCHFLGGDLVSFSTETENTYVLKTLLWGGATVGDIDNTKAVYFDGVNDQATIPRVDLRTTDFTLAIWIKPIAPWGFVNTVMEDYKDGKVQFVIYFYYGGLNVPLFSVDGKTTLGLGGIPLDQWTHLTVTWNRAQKTAKLFADAIERNSKTATYQNIDLVDNPHPVWRLGARDGVSNKYFKGWMRDLIVIPKALPLEEIQKLKDGKIPNAWIGLNDMASEGLFQWSDGSQLTFTNTGYTADNTVAKHCVMMKGANQWLVKECNEKASFVCKKKAE